MLSDVTWLSSIISTLSEIDGQLAGVNAVAVEITESGEINSLLVVVGVSVVSMTSIDSDGVWECCRVVQDDDETTGKSERVNDC